MMMIYEWEEMRFSSATVGEQFSEFNNVVFFVKILKLFKLIISFRVFDIEIDE